ncbi:MAG: hypothetical protein U0904_01815 [Candidatus Nanopelagicales bacterium]|nr:hypothetical protein [Candidatus Nanopelagicales bacterium]
MSTSQAAQADTKAGADVSLRVAAGALGGLVGGMVFGMMMQLMNMIPNVAMLVGSGSIAVGWGVHLAVSVVLGIGFGIVAVRGLDSWGRGIGMGVGYGVIWWVLGFLLLMPAKLGMPVFAINTIALESLMGHMIYGAVLGAVAVAIMRLRARSA